MNEYTGYFVHLFSRLAESFEMKAVFGAFIAMMTYLFDPTQHAALLALFILILADFCFGITASRKEGHPVRSSKVRRTAIKMTVYFAIIAMTRITENAIPLLTFMDETLVGFLAATELLSILENVGRMGYAVPQKLAKVLGDYTQKS